MVDREFETPNDNSIWLWPEAAPCEVFDENLPDEELAEALKFRPWLDPYLLDTEEARPAVVIYPGGGYAIRAPHEAGPVAKRFNELGFHAFVCHYRVSPYKYPAAFMDAGRAVRIVRANAEKWNVRPDAIAVLGFSAGGHLCGHIATCYGSCNCDFDDDIQKVSPRPDAAIPCYAVLSFTSHVGSYKNLLGAQYTEELARSICPAEMVHAGMPPVFLWSTAEDKTVPVTSSLEFASKLHAADVPFEMHIFPFGRHGIGLADDFEDSAQWPRLAGDWLNATFAEKE